MRDKFIKIRVSESEKTLFQNKAKTAGMSVSDFLRDSATKKEIVVYKGMAMFIRQLQLIGNNLNQLTIASHQGVNVISLEKFIQEVNSIWQSLNALLHR